MTKSKMRHALLLGIALSSAAPVVAQQSLQQRVEGKLNAAKPGTRFGFIVATEDGRELVAINPEQRFIPASNTKMFITAAAFANLPVDQPDVAGGTGVRLDMDGRSIPDAVLVGRGDARLSGRADCVSNCLAALADAVASKTKVVRDVVGDDTLFPDERWGPGMSWNNIQTRYGTGLSALMVDDNELPIRILPAAVGQAPTLDVLPYYKIDNQALTVSGGKPELEYFRLPGSNVVRLTGTIPAGGEPQLLRIGIDDPAHYAAWRFKSLLEARGVRVIGGVSARHRPLTKFDDPEKRNGAPAMRPPESQFLAQLTPPPLAEDLRQINKVSQNVHSDLMLRRLGRTHGSGSIADGLERVGAMMDAAGVPKEDYDFADGSGMSTYNRVAPRGMITLLRWISAQPWGAAWRSTLPIGGEAGTTLSNRFKGTSLEGKIFAKTGTLNASAALSGYMTAKSGRTLLISTFANDIPEDGSVSKTVDAALEMIALEN